MSHNMFKGYKYQKLFNHMLDQHGKILCQDEMRQIVKIVREMDKDNVERKGKENQQPTANSQRCDDCDLPDACSDYGCAIKQGLRRNEEF